MNFWNQLEKKPKPEIETLLTKKLGKSNNELNNNLFQELVKKLILTIPHLPNKTTLPIL